MCDQTKTTTTGKIRICLGRQSLSLRYLQQMFVNPPLAVTRYFDGTSTDLPDLIHFLDLTEDRTAASLLKTLPDFTFAQTLVIILAMLEACQYGPIGLPLLGHRAVFKVETSDKGSALLTCHNKTRGPKGWQMQIFDPKVSATFVVGTRLFSPTKIGSL